MTALYIVLGIVLLLALILSVRAKIFIRLDGGLTVRAGAGPVILTLMPKKDKEKKRRKPHLSAFSYKKHQKRLERDAEKAARKAQKKQKKAEKKRLKNKARKISAKAEKSAQKAEKSLSEKIEGVFDLVGFILDEFPRLASYIRTNVREMKITVGSSDAAKTAELYGGISALCSALLELLDCKTKMKASKEGSISVAADFFSEKTSAVIDISMMISVFSVLRVGWHTLKWLISKKLKEKKKQK